MGVVEFPYLNVTRALLSRSTLLWITTLALSLAAAGCGRSPQPLPDVRPTVKVGTPSPDSAEKEVERPAVYHVVQPGQTLWSISQRYGLTVEELARVNNISDPDRLFVDQRLLIPGTRALGWAWPVPGGKILSPFGEHRRGHRHAGLDIRGQDGQEVLAVRSGRVRYSSTMRDYGKTVIVDHGDGLSSLYAHNSKLLVAVGQRVRRAQPIARIGRTGNATTEHCHFEIRRGEISVDPLLYIRPVK